MPGIYGILVWKRRHCCSFLVWKYDTFPHFFVPANCLLAQEFECTLLVADMMSHDDAVRVLFVNAVQRCFETTGLHSFRRIRPPATVAVPLNLFGTLRSRRKIMIGLVYNRLRVGSVKQMIDFLVLINYLRVATTNMIGFVLINHL